MTTHDHHARRYYRIMRAALTRYEKATNTYNQIIAEYSAKETDQTLARIKAMADQRLKTAASDQNFFGTEARTYALAWLVERGIRDENA